MTTGRKVTILGGLLLLLLLSVWILTGFVSGTGDEQRFRKMVRAMSWGWRLHRAEKRIPTALVPLLQSLKTKCFHNAEALEDVLLTSGYLTNTSVTITNFPAGATNERLCLAEVQRRLRASGQAGNKVDYLSYHVETNQAVVMCRSRDLRLVRAAIQTP